ncbi:MAG: hypothetical protein IJF34_05520 [Clostridia bacterium]|nr:hypothetical protein [Clostridia bacterium]
MNSLPLDENTTTWAGISPVLYNGWKKYDKTAKGAKKLMYDGVASLHNGSWMFGKFRTGYIVIDIGLSTKHSRMGVWYGAERFVSGLWNMRHIWKIPIKSEKFTS